MHPHPDNLIIEHYFRNKAKGIYIDVGAYHPIMGNNTFKLFNKGWSGINIDLDFHTIDILNNFRPNDENIIAAVSDKIEKKKLYFPFPKFWGNLFIFINALLIRNKRLSTKFSMEDKKPEIGFCWIILI